ncbi:LTA synthase family protein [Lysinibacillus sp. LZ02]|uniref:LTA synthase family protein n=1 Tax=Lysinibacillus sp. LZ02 TaxID=3420668 RepID=UPI003D361367
MNIFILSIFMLLAYISQIKIDLRGEPLSILDYSLIMEAFGVINGFKINYFIPVIIIVIIITSIILSAKKIKGRQGIITGSIYSGISLFILIIVYIIDIEDFSRINVSIPADTSFNHENNGFIFASVIDTKFLSIPEPDNYSSDTIENIIQKMDEYAQHIKETSDETFENPNIIFVMSESFSTPNNSMNLDTNRQVTPNFNYYAKQAISGTIQVPGVGGGTANTEFEVLTGFSKDHILNYSVPYNPYNTYINKNVNSLASEFAQQNYETLAIHSYHSWFYKRDSVYKYLGFKKFLPIEFMNQENLVGRFLDDAIINDEIIQQINKTPERDFIYAVTMASHGPYDIDNGDEITVSNELPDKSIVENYLNAIHLSDQRLGELIRYFEKYDEPTMIIFFGDHIPPLGQEFYKSIGLSMESKDSKKAPLLIWSNYEEQEVKKVSVKANLLGAFILDEVNYYENDYFTYLGQALKKYNNKDYLDDLYNLQYDILHGKRYFYNTKIEYINNQYTIGNEVKLENMAAKQFDNFTMLELVGDNFTPTVKLSIDNDRYPIQLVNRKKAYAYIPNIKLQSIDNIGLVVIDSKNTVINMSNSLKGSQVTIYKEKLFPNWYNAHLNGQQYWEIFDVKSDYIIVRLDLPKYSIEGERPYFIMKDNEKLDDKDADYIDRSLLSDIYVNGYLYLSIPRDKSWSNPDLESIKKYFDKENYILYTEY